MWDENEFGNGGNGHVHTLLSRGEDDLREKLHEIFEVVNEVKGALSASARKMFEWLNIIPYVKPS
jgi:hypothetical protein